MKWSPRAALLVVTLLVLSQPLAFGDEESETPPYTEEQRQAEYFKRGNTWPPKIIPKTKGWSNILQERFDQVQALTDMQQKWDGIIQTLSSALLKNYTQYGWGLTRAPEELTDEIREAIYEGLPHARSEGATSAIDGPVPWFIDRPDLTSKALVELQPILEAWSGIELVPSIAYGFRLYRNESRLWMHVDRTQTHVISCIYHIASSEDSEPWPIVIEDYEGNTNSVVLESGDILLYESAKNFHGRPTYFNGTWSQDTSLFVHFYPKDPEWEARDHDLDSHYAVPPDWDRIVPSDHPNVIVYGTSMMMPECPDSWCPLLNAIDHFGPGKYGEVLTGGGKRYSLELIDEEAEEL